MANSPSSNPSKRDFSSAIRDAVYTGIIAFGLFVLLIGLQSTTNIRNELILVPRVGLLSVVVGLAMLGRFIMSAYVQPYNAQKKAFAAANPVAQGEPSYFRKNFSKIAILFLFVYSHTYSNSCSHSCSYNLCNSTVTISKYSISHTYFQLCNIFYYSFG